MTSAWTRTPGACTSAKTPSGCSASAPRPRGARGIDTEGLAGEPFCYITTAGRITGRPHQIEIWFAMQGSTIYMLSGGRGRSDWVRNIVKTPRVSVRIGEREFAGSGRIVTDADEHALARRLLLEKYAPTYSGDLTDWGRTALPVAIDLDAPA